MSTKSIKVHEETRELLFKMNGTFLWLTMYSVQPVSRKYNLQTRTQRTVEMWSFVCYRMQVKPWFHVKIEVF